MTAPFWILLGATLVFAVVEMTVTFVAAQRWRNYGIVDVVWSGGFTVIALMAFAGVTAVTIGTGRWVIRTLRWPPSAARACSP